MKFPDDDAASRFLDSVKSSSHSFTENSTLLKVKKAKNKVNCSNDCALKKQKNCRGQNRLQTIGKTDFKQRVVTVGTTNTVAFIQEASDVRGSQLTFACFHRSSFFQNEHFFILHSSCGP